MPAPPLPAAVVYRRHWRLFCRQGQQQPAAGIHPLRGRCRPPIPREITDPRCCAADCGKYRQAAGAFAKGIANRTHIRACESPVENRWNSSGKLVVRGKIPVTCYLFGAALKNAERVGLWIRPCPSNLSERFWAGPFSTSDRSFVRALQHAFRAIIRD